MKRILIIVGVVLGLGAVGLTAAFADNSGVSTHCTDGVTPPAEHDIPNGFVGLSYENPGPATDPSYVQVCYSTTPNGSSSPEAAGGKFVVWGPSNGTQGGYCEGDRNAAQTVAVDCSAGVTQTDPTSAPGTTASGSFKVGTTGPVPLGQTGAEVDPATSTNAPLSSATPGSGGSAGLGSGTCTYVDGGTPTCPFGFTIGGVTVNEGDASVPTTHPNSGGCVTAAGNPCVTTVPSGIGVSILKGDTSNDTVTVDVLGTPVSRDLGDCIGFNAGAGC